MINRSQLVWTGALIIVVLLMAYLTLLSHQTIKQQKQHQADGYLINVAYTHYNSEGQPKAQLFSPKLLHFPDDDSVDLTTPHFIFFGKTGNPWNVYSVYGRYYHKEDKLILWKHVRIHQTAGAKNNDTTMLTSRLIAYPSTEFAETDRPVDIFQPGAEVNAVGLKAYIKKGIVELLSNTKGHYDPNKAHKPGAAPQKK